MTNLINLPENEVLTLTPSQAYERTRAISRLEASNISFHHRGNTNAAVKDKSAYKRSRGGFKVFKAWVD
jgi:hypothetical protein